MTSIVHVHVQITVINTRAKNAVTSSQETGLRTLRQCRDAFLHALYCHLQRSVPETNDLF